MKLPKIFKTGQFVKSTLFSAVLLFTILCSSISIFAASSPKPDLRPGKITYGENLITGKLIGFDCLVRNAGTANSVGFAVKWFVDGNEVSTGSHIGIPAQTASIDEDSTLFYYFKKPGTYTIAVKVDSNDEIAESNELNNLLSIKVTVTVPQTDLVPTAITASATTNIKLGQHITFDSGVRNAGGADSPGFSVKWFVNSIQFGYGSHEPVPANTTSMNGNSQFEYTFNSPGTYTITFQVDSDKVIAEANEANNETSIQIVVPPTDLVPTGLSASAITNIKVGQPITFTSGIKNNGGVDASNFSVKWTINGVEAARIGHSAVPAYNTVSDDKDKFTYVFNTAGTYTITCQIDPDNKLNESNINNNTSSMTITILSPDLVPTMITTTECVYIKVGQPVTFKCGIRNDGGVDTGVFNVKWFIDGAQVGAHSYIGVPARTVIDEVSRLDFTFTTPGNHTVLFQVDSSNFVDEYNEIDNETTSIVSVTN